MKAKSKKALLHFEWGINNTHTIIWCFYPPSYDLICTNENSSVPSTLQFSVSQKKRIIHLWGFISMGVLENWNLCYVLLFSVFYTFDIKVWDFFQKSFYLYLDFVVSSISSREEKTCVNFLINFLLEKKIKMKKPNIQALKKHFQSQFCCYIMKKKLNSVALIYEHISSSSLSK